MIGAEEIRGLFGTLLDQIQDPMIRGKTMRAWALGCEKGGWDSVDQLKQMPFTLSTDTYGVNFIEHILAVTYGAMGLANAQRDNYANPPYQINMDRVIAGALLHDLGKLLEIEPDGSGGFRKSLAGKHTRHPILGTILATEVELPGEYLNIIACHSTEGEGRPQVIETILIHQADFATFNPLIMRGKGNLIE